MAPNKPQQVRATPKPAAAPAPVQQVAPVENVDEAAPVQAAYPPDDMESAGLRSQQLRAGGRRSANERVARLEYPRRQGWHQCWINDQPGNIGKFKELGYEFRIDAATKERISRVAGTAEGGGGLITYLMEIPEAIYKEDQKALEAEMNGIDSQIRRAAIEGEAKDLGLHVPKNADGSSRIKMEPVR